MNEYEKQAVDFLESTRVQMAVIKAVPQKSPLWSEDGKHGIHYVVYFGKINDGHEHNKHDNPLDRPYLYGNVVNFDFWDSIANKEKPVQKKPTAYDILASLNYYNDNFEDWCFSFGYDDDSRKAYKTYELVQELNKKLEKVFTFDELQKLNDIV